MTIRDLLKLLLMGVAIASLQGCGGGTAVAAPSSIESPKVQAVFPANHKTAVAKSSILSVTFSDAMIPTTVNTSTFTLIAAGASPVTGTVSYSGRTAQFKPAAPLAPETVYSATVTTGIKCVDGGELANDYSWTFVTAETVDTTPPQVTFTDFGVAMFQGVYGGLILATFTEPMDTTTLNSDTFLVVDPSGLPFTGTVAYVGLTAVFVPTHPFAPDSTYTATLTTGAKDLEGVALAEDHVWTFTTPPISVLTGKSTLVTNTAPADLATGIPRGSSISVTFNQVMDPFSLTPNTFLIIDPDGAPVSGTVTYTGYTATFTPTFPLLPNNTYRGLIKAGAASLAGVPMDADYKWLFTTSADLAGTPPVVQFTSPLDGDTSVKLNTSIIAAFDESMDPTTINAATFTVTQPDGSPVPGTVTCTGLVAVFIPDSQLLPGIQYVARIKGSVTDAGGTPMANDYVWTFTTGELDAGDVPQVLFSDPGVNDTNISPYKKIDIAFNEVMNPLTLTTATITLTAADGTPVQGTINYFAFAIEFVPAHPLAPGQTYTVTVSGTVKDLEGVPLGADYSWNFFTATPL